MANTLTLNRIKLMFEDLANNHLMIHDYGFGPAYNIGNDKPLNFPFMWIEPVNTRVVSGKGNSQAVEYYTFNMIVMDKINKGDSNYLDTSSDCDYISKTIFAELDQHTTFIDLDMVIDGDWSSEPVYEATEDNSNGWQSTFTIKLPLRYSPCNDPFPVLNPTYSIGDSFGGGKIFYILEPTDVGYDASKITYLITINEVDITKYYEWGATGSYVGNTMNEIGYGLSNSTAVANYYSGTNSCREALNYIESGYSDWYLPSVDEFGKMNDNYFLLGGWGDGSRDFWTSTEYNYNTDGDFAIGYTYIGLELAQSNLFKPMAEFIRPIRTQAVDKYLIKK